MTAETITGTLDRITFHNPENGFLVGRFLPDPGQHPITIRGNLFRVQEGEALQLSGQWDDHPRYGHQFLVVSYQVLQPTTLLGMERYLASKVPGVGEVLAKKIVKTFGARTFEIMDTQPELLLEVPRFPKRALQEVKDSWAEHRAAREVLVFLHSLGISPGLADRIFTSYGLLAPGLIRDNPYRLAMDVHGVGFRTADDIAKGLGIAADSPHRLDAAVLYVMDEIQGEGHTGYPRGLLVRRTAQLLDQTPEAALDAVERLTKDGSLKELPAPAVPEGEGQEIGAGPLLFRPRLYKSEQAIVRHLRRILAGPPAVQVPDVERLLGEIERAAGLYLAPEQRHAVSAALEHKVLILTGGPGTGKTTIVRFILGLVRSVMPNLALAAPTGKAAKRLSEATGLPASTIHRLLEAGQRGFERHAQRPLDAQLVIVDESSMIDTPLMEALLDAIPTPARLVLVGDVDQLPSVGPGRVLGDLIASALVPTVRLERIFRQSSESLITAHAHDIRRGVMPRLARAGADLGPDSLVDFYFWPEGNPERIVEKLLALVTERIPQRFGLDPKQDVQVLTPMHRGLTGAQHLNQVLQDALNPTGRNIATGRQIASGRGTAAGEQRFRVGDKVIQNRNDYTKEVFNGDMGVIVDARQEPTVLQIQFDERIVPYEPRDLDSLGLGYALTVHKAQGSEYPAVVLPLSMQHAIMLQRNLLYTALTRGRRLVVIIGTEQAVRMAVNNAKPVVRHTGLLARLAMFETAEPAAAQTEAEEPAPAAERSAARGASRAAEPRGTRPAIQPVLPTGER